MNEPKDTTAYTLRGGRIVTPGGVVERDLTIENGRIRFGFSADKVVDVSGRYVLPGFVDIHFHGYRLFSFTCGLYDPTGDAFDASPAAYAKGFAMLEELLPSFGVTGLYVGTFAAGIDELRRAFARLRDHIEERRESAGRGTRIHGGLLEGTFLNPDMAGAQNPEFVFPPSIDTFDAIDDGGVIRLVNAVPDYGEESRELIRRLAARGITVGAGHTDATARQVREGVDAGLRYIIHFTNGPTGGSYKPFDGGGAVEGILASDELFVELICDGYHVNPAYVRDIIARKDPTRVVAVTDAIYMSGSSLKEINLSGIRGRVSDDGRYFSVVGKKNTLFSSNLTMNRAFENLLNWQTVESAGVWRRSHPALSLPEALVRTAAMCAANPCRLTGRGEEGVVGEGMRADLCVADVSGEAGGYSLDVAMTLIGGEIAYSREEAPL